jgi:hypothetical protein
MVAYCTATYDLGRDDQRFNYFGSEPASLDYLGGGGCFTWNVERVFGFANGCSVLGVTYVTYFVDDWG